MNTYDNPKSIDDSARKAALSRRLEGIGWGVLLITVGTIWLLPKQQVPPGTWLIAAGLVILGFSAIRYFNGLRISGLALIVGILAALAGLGEYFRLELPLFAIALIVVGICLLFGRLLKKDSASATGRGWSCCWPQERENQLDATGGPKGGN